VFRRIGTLTRVRRNEQSNPILEPLSEGALRGLLARTADWHRVTITGNLAAVSPPIDVVQDILALSEWPDIPPIRGIVEAPTFAPDGSLLTHAGYHPAAQLWFHCAPGLDAPVISSKPKESEIEAAREFLLYELLGEFPFEDEASRAHVLVATLLPFVREMVLGPTPLHLIDAPSPGTGKGLLADVINIPATGRSATIMSEGQNDEEWRKRITAILMGGPVFVLIDNLRQRLDSPALAAALTGGTWTDRILGRTAMATLPVRAVWVATGNNITLSNEMARRAVRIRLDAKVDKPWTRSGFTHPKLREWALRNRGPLVQACLTLIQAWIVADRPAGEITLGSFEAWAETMGGILKVAGVPGFLGNTAELYQEADEETRAWREFILAWWEKYKWQCVGARELYSLARGSDLLSEILGDGGEQSQRTRLGRALGGMRDRIIGTYRIMDGGEDNKGRRRYCLQRTSSNADVAPASAAFVEGRSA
jgi:hypothetical protein